MKKHPQLFLKVLPDSKRAPQNIGNPQKQQGLSVGVPQRVNRSHNMTKTCNLFTLIPKSAKGKAIQRKFRTVDRSENSDEAQGAKKFKSLRSKRKGQKSSNR